MPLQKKSLLPDESSQRPSSETTKNANEVIYFNGAKNYQIGNYKAEIRSSTDRVLQPEKPIRFQNHLLVLDLKDTEHVRMRDFIEGNPEKDIEPCIPWKNGHIIKCKNMMQARQLIMKRNAKKSVRVIEGDMTESQTLQFNEI